MGGQGRSLNKLTTTWNPKIRQNGIIMKRRETGKTPARREQKREQKLMKTRNLERRLSIN